MTIDLTRLPRRRLGVGDHLYRIHREKRGPWFFSSDGKGRFDPVGTGRGTCYLATSELGAWVETFRTAMTLAEDDVSSRVISTAELDRTLELIDLTNRRALAAGITAAFASGEDYDPCHRLSRDLQHVCDGLMWRVRHDLEQSLIGVSLFGPEGEQPAEDWPSLDTLPIGVDLIREAEDEFGYRVLPTL